MQFGVPTDLCSEISGWAFSLALLENISVVSAFIVSTLVLMLSWPGLNSWPAFYLIAGAALGLATGIVFWQTKSVLACAVANASFTVGAIALQLWRLP